MNDNCESNGENKNAFRIQVGKSEEKDPFENPRRRLEDNIKVTFKEVIWISGDWMYVTQNRDKWLAVVKTAMNLRIP